MAAAHAVGVEAARRSRRTTGPRSPSPRRRPARRRGARTRPPRRPPGRTSRTGSRGRGASALASAAAEPRAVLLEPGEADARRGSALEPTLARARRRRGRGRPRAAGADALERVDDDVPPLLDREAPDAYDEQRSRLRAPPRSSRRRGLVRAPEREGRAVDAERHVDDVRHAGGAEPGAPAPRPRRTSRRTGARSARIPAIRGADTPATAGRGRVRARAPRTCPRGRRARTRSAPAAGRPQASDGGHRQVRRVGLEDVGLLGAHTLRILSKRPSRW